ncbi:Salivary plasminogen activator alpha 1 [Labeo rohita]|uniref:Salivary plasminogen activator alpha 1 n=1 Tax=Labeo rohita TaxID=84645 RepID=A0ABQ8LB57_LABRO|nr:Salivary plasminogen activator alpha 1 [Labeo rohita]
MFVLGLITCVVLRAFRAQAKVFDSLVTVFWQQLSLSQRNHEEKPDICLMSVSQLNNELMSHFGTNQPISIFADDCFVIDNNLVEVQLVFQKLINLPVTQADQISSEIQNTFSSDSTPSEKKFKVNGNTGNIAFDSMSTYYDMAENLKIFAGSDCLITYTKSTERTFVHDELRKRQVSESSVAVECQLVPENQKNEKTAADGTSCYNVYESDYSCRCYTGGETVPCCSTPCLYMDKLKGYRCYSDQKLIECSPPYSLITVNGERCKNDFPCATYGLDYYWCFNFNYYYTSRLLRSHV